MDRGTDLGSIAHARKADWRQSGVPLDRDYCWSETREDHIRFEISHLLSGLVKAVRFALRHAANYADVAAVELSRTPSTSGNQRGSGTQFRLP